jgi:hypothetical protein
VTNYTAGNTGCEATARLSQGGGSIVYKSKQDSKRRAELAELVEQHRRELGERPDISQTMRRLSQSSSWNSATNLQPKRRLRLRALVLTGAALVVLLACVAGTVAVVWTNSVVQSGFSDPQNTVQQFYGALHQTNYAQAYSYFSGTAKAHLSESTFANLYGSYDRVDGIIQNFPVQSSVVHSSVAQVVVLVTRRGDDDTGQMQTVHLVSSNNTWYIDSIVVGNTVPLPTSTGAP